MRLFILLFPLLLCACGFELRGASVLPPELGKLHLIADRVLTNDVNIYLQGGDTQLVGTRAEANVVLTLSNPRYERRVLSVDPNTGYEREFELSYSVDVIATDAQGKLLLEPQTLSQQRDYVFDRTTLIGSGNEEYVLQTEMRRDLVQQVLSRLRAATAG